MGWTRKHLLTMRELDASEIVLLIDTAASLQEIATREIKKVPALRGKTIVNLFYEPSTRTRTSFEIAGKWLSADVRSEEHTSELQSHSDLVCRLLLEKKKKHTEKTSTSTII